jgi:hypothetical protein
MYTFYMEVMHSTRIKKTTNREHIAELLIKFDVNYFVTDSLNCKNICMILEIINNENQ